jgi:hypothetical protein
MAPTVPDGESRWMAVESVCRILHQDPAVRAILSSPNVSKLTRHSSPAEFTQVQLIDGAHLESAVPELVRRIATCIVENPPYWHKRLRRTDTNKDALVRVMTDASVSAQTAWEHEHEALTPQDRKDLLALRGLLAHGVLVHFLKRRFRVDYGIKADAVKRMAVPYRASDTPSERSEFSHSDSAILLTYLSYYYQGLNATQVIRL